MILSIIVVVSPVVESKNVVRLQSGALYLYIFAIFLKTDFLDMVSLCCRPLI